MANLEFIKLFTFASSSDSYFSVLAPAFIDLARDKAVLGTPLEALMIGGMPSGFKSGFAL